MTVLPRGTTEGDGRASGSGQPVLELLGLTKRYGDRLALDELTCRVFAGEIVGLLGPNGAGKTTTMKLALGLLKPTQGAARVCGLDCVAEAEKVKERIGHTPDEPAFFDYLSARETLDFSISVRGVDRAESWARLSPLIDRLDFGAMLDEQVGGYSHGTKKKLSLLAAMVHSPRLLLLDEPTNGLDPGAAARVRALLSSFAGAGGAVVVSTHLLDMADNLCSRVLVLNQGRLLAEGTTRQIRERAGVTPGASLEEAFLAMVGHE